MSGQFSLQDSFKGKGKLVERIPFDSPKTKRRKLCLSLKRSRESTDKCENLGVASGSTANDESLQFTENDIFMGVERNLKDVSTLNSLTDSESQSFFASSPISENMIDSFSQNESLTSVPPFTETVDTNISQKKISSETKWLKRQSLSDNDEVGLMSQAAEVVISEMNTKIESTKISATNYEAISEEKRTIDTETTQLNDKRTLETVEKDPPTENNETVVENLSSKLPYVPGSLRKGDNVFTKDQVKKWSSARIHAWENRHVNPDAFYYRFVDPGELQANGGFNKKDHEYFMARLKDFKEKGYRIGSAWGIFSMGIPHKSGYQCSSYYRKLIEQRKVEDPSYVIVNGKLSMIDKGRKDGRSADGVLSVAWEMPEVQEVEKNINQWLKDFHNRDISQVSLTKKPTKPKNKALFSNVQQHIQTEAPKPTKNHNPMLSKLSTKQLDLDDEFEIFPGIKTKPVNKTVQPESKLLQKYKELVPSVPSTASLLSKSSKASTLSQYMDHVKRAHARKILEFTPVQKLIHRVSHPTTTSVKTKLNNLKPLQRDLSAFWQGVKSPRVEGPEPPIYKIPFDIPSTWAKKITPANEIQQPASPLTSTRNIYIETNDLLNLNFDDIFEKRTSDDGFEGVLIDPPWELLMADDIRSECYLQVEQLESLLEKVLTYLPMGLIFIWTHKILTPDVVHIMLKLDCRYVENLAWFKKKINNTHTDHPSSYFRRSKETLLIFKKGDGFDIRHQRTADVIIDFEKPKSHWIEQEYTEPKPAEVYEMIETILPTSKDPTPMGDGRLLELWCKRDSRDRAGWVTIHENKKHDPTLAGNQIHIWSAGEVQTL